MATNELPDDVTKQFVELLRELLASDPEVIQALYEFSVPCRKEFTDHPVIIVREEMEGKETKISLSVLGLINSLLSKIGQRPIAANLEDESDKVLGFQCYRGPLDD